MFPTVNPDQQRTF